MQGYVVELIRELMQTQQMSVRKISAQIARKHGGSALGYTQQINRILNDPAYDPSFSTVEKILTALNCSLWQTDQGNRTQPLEVQIGQLNSEVAEMKIMLSQVSRTILLLAERLSEIPETTAPPSDLVVSKLNSIS